MKNQKPIEQYVTDYLNKSSLDYKGMWPNDVVIDIACEVGEQILHDRHPDMNHWIQHEHEDCSRFTEESQELFNQYYDEATAHLEQKHMQREKTVEQYVTDFTLNVPIEWCDENVIQIACEVAAQMLNDKHPDMEHTYQEPIKTIHGYTPESQVLFDQYYDQVRAYLESKDPANTRKEE